MPATLLMSPVETFEGRHRVLKTSEDDKDCLIEELLNHVRSLNQELHEAQVSAKRQSDLVHLYDGQKEEASHKLRDLEQKIAELGFIVVLVDGDAMQFVDSLVTQNEDGGQEAARRLRSAVLDHVKEQNLDLPPNVKVMIRVFANLKGLAATYQRCKIVRQPEDYVCFQRGFAMEHPLTDFVDVGYGKDRADEKLKESFKLFIADIHCKHVMFCGSTDNGYARLLEQYISPPETCKRISLVEGPPFERELVRVKEYFSSFKIPSVFRSTKLSDSQPAPETVRRASPPMGTPSQTTTAAVRPLNFAATAAHGTTDGSQRTISIRTQDKIDFRPGVISLNREEFRIDPPRPPKVSDADIFYIKRKKYCNPYHLTGSCIYGINCTFDHDEKLNAKQLEVLRYVARMTPCPKGPRCRDSTCILGHVCFRRPCLLDHCMFTPEMHNPDPVVVSHLE